MLRLLHQIDLGPTPTHETYRLFLGSVEILRATDQLLSGLWTCQHDDDRLKGGHQATDVACPVLVVSVHHRTEYQVDVSLSCIPIPIANRMPALLSYARKLLVKTSFSIRSPCRSVRACCQGALESQEWTKMPARSHLSRKSVPVDSVPRSVMMVTGAQKY